MKIILIILCVALHANSIYSEERLKVIQGDYRDGLDPNHQIDDFSRFALRSLSCQTITFNSEGVPIYSVGGELKNGITLNFKGSERAWVSGRNVSSDDYEVVDGDSGYFGIVCDSSYSGPEAFNYEIWWDRTWNQKEWGFNGVLIQTWHPKDVSGSPTIIDIYQIVLSPISKRSD